MHLWRNDGACVSPPFVYFLRIAGFVKIGLTHGDPARRFLNIQACNPHEMTILGVIEGDRTVELQWHARFHELHVRGEWFRERPELTRAIDALAHRSLVIKQPRQRSNHERKRRRERFVEMANLAVESQNSGTFTAMLREGCDETSSDNNALGESCAS